jgi:DNA repair exonuclease SbcCD ATPase subunit
MRATHELKNGVLRVGMVMALCLAVTPLLQAQDNSQQTGDAVADAARKARESKKTEPKPKKVFTDDDVSTRAPNQQPASGTAPNTNPTTGEPQPAASPNEGGEDAKTGQPKESDETKWRKRFKAARDKLATAQKQLDILQRDLNKNEVQYYPDPQKAMQEQYSREGINKRKAKIDEKEAEVAKLKQALSDLEDDLRKSGGDIGWSRE